MYLDGIAEGRGFACKNIAVWRRSEKGMGRTWHWGLGMVVGLGRLWDYGWWCRRIREWEWMWRGRYPHIVTLSIACSTHCQCCQCLLLTDPLNFARYTMCHAINLPDIRSMFKCKNNEYDASRESKHLCFQSIDTAKVKKMEMG